MGKLKERQTTTIHCELIAWHRVVSNYFTGIVWNSTDEEFSDGKPITIQFQVVQHYPRLNGHWNDHYICKTFSGLYFMLDFKHEVPTR